MINKLTEFELTEFENKKKHIKPYESEACELEIVNSK